MVDPEIIDHLEDGQEEEILPLEYEITSYGADFPVDGLVQRLQKEIIFVPTFQRGFVWSIRRSSEFIESLLLGLPVPAIFLSKEPNSDYLVIDGQQRLKTLQFFYEGIFSTTKQEFELKDLGSRFNGLTYKTLPEDDRKRLDNSLIHAIIVKQDKPSEDNSSTYHIFERLNSGGVLLQAQEIRAAIYHGSFNDCLQKMNRNESWRSIFGPPHSRMRDQELILRFLALHEAAESYAPPMKKFLNSFMARNRNLDTGKLGRFEKNFCTAIDICAHALGKDAFKPARTLNAAVFDSVMVGVASRMRSSPINPIEVDKNYKELLANRLFANATETGTSHKDNVQERLRRATEAFRV